MNEKEAYELGKDCGLNGANTTNSNFRIFSKTEYTTAWTKGRDDALSQKTEVKKE